MPRRFTITLLTSTAVLVAVSIAQTPPKVIPSGISHAIVLGVGSPAINPQRSGTSIGIAAGDTLYVFDAGPGVGRRLMEAQPQLAAWKVQQFGPVFITHLHMDHTLDVPTFYRYQRLSSDGTLKLGGGPFRVYGPPSINEFMNQVKAAFGGAIRQEAIVHEWDLPTDAIPQG